ncbi:hypothetical protein [Spiroplasma floricola]|uniref:ABC transporter permease n=1 Tax=Spiroplasma floricola 23-6 TaxID=1336749 RepID=A0A2K8SCX5_9MOLU|nr:hypothetical protein [Spiroplasma floricola]AUB31165.1 ABC transporter permease [Spiroplasma floricola 23-6]
MEQATLKLVKTQKPKKEKKFNGFKTLYLINLKRLIRNKGILATSIISMIITLIFSLTVANTMKSPETAMEIGLIMLSIGFIIQIFFFILFMIIMSTELIKKQMLDGIQNIETRSGMKFKTSFLLRWLVFITFVGGVWAINTLITILTSSSVLFKFDLISGIIFGTCIFYLFLVFFWTPIIFFITIICSIAWSVMLNIFITLVLVFSGMISSIPMLFSNDQIRNNTMVMNLNLRLEIANSFYNTFKDDENINFIFNDNEMNNQTSKFSAAINSNKSLKTQNINVTDLYYYNLISNDNIKDKRDVQILERSLYGGKPNLKYSYNSEDASVTPKNVLSGTDIFEKILNPIYEEVLKGMKSDNNKPPVSKPAYMGGFINKRETSQGFHDLAPLSKWLSKQEDTKKYASLLKWVEKIYSNYSFTLTATRPYGSYSSGSGTYEPYIFASKFISNNNQENFDDEINTEANRVYKRYPELMIINDIITETWLNTMMSRTELYRNTMYGSSSGSSFKQDEVYSTYQEWVNKSILKNNLNIFQHFSIMYGQLFGKAMNKDLIFSNSILAYSGITTGYSNYQDLNKVDIRNRSSQDQNKPLEPIFKDVKLKKKFGFSAPLAYLMYLLVSFAMMYLVYLLWSRRSKI